MTQLEIQRAADIPAGVYQDLEEMLMANIIRHCRDYEQPIATDVWLMKKLAEIGKLNQENIQIIAKATGLSQTAMERMLNDTAEEAIAEMESAMKTAAQKGLVGAAVSVDQSRNVKQVLTTMREQAKDTLNLCNTTMLYKARDAYQKFVKSIASTAQEIADKQEFIEILNKNATAALIGAESRQQALTKCVREFNERGIPAFVDKRGREWTPEAYVNMAMRSTSNTMAAEIQMARADDYGIDLVEVDSHSGARPKCARDQGKIFDRSNRSDKYPHWNTSSYGEPDGLLGINCGHHIYPFVEGISIRRYFPTEDMEANDKLYKETQMQRALERDVRKQKRECMLYDELGNEDEFEKAAVKLKAKEARLKQYVDGNPDLHRRGDREQVVGFDKRISAEAVAANKRNYKEFVKSVGEKNAPSFTKYSDIGYGKSEEYKELTAFAKYREKVPDADLSHYRLNEKLHAEGLIRGKVVPIKKKQAYILEDISHKKEPAHIMKRMLERNITDDQVQDFVDSAVLCVEQFQGTRLVYYAEEGVTVLTKTSDYGDVEWIAKTTWSKYDYDENTEKILKEAKKYVQSGR